jgi:hypothetical protein
MNAIQLYDKVDEEIVGTVLLKENVSFSEIADAWDEYQETHNFDLENEPDIYEFVSENKNLCIVLNVEFYQP